VFETAMAELATGRKKMSREQFQRTPWSGMIA